MSNLVNHNVEKPFLYIARMLLNDPNLEYRETPALQPPKVAMDEAFVRQLEKDVAAACAEPIPEDDDSDLDLNL